MYRFELAVVVDAPSSRVWRALCDPDEVVRWESGVTAAIDAPPDYPRPGQHVHWRANGRLLRVLHDRPREVEPERKLRSLLAAGPVHYDETYTLEEVPRSSFEGFRTSELCRLTASVEVRLPVPFLGSLAERFYLGPATRRAFALALSSLKRHCEAGS